jgi:arsenate reductase
MSMTIEQQRPARVLFLCMHNSARSQMAEGLLRSLGGNGVEVESAGTAASFVRPEAISVMNELGIDISGHESKTLEQFLNQPFDDVITVCDKAFESCPFFPGAHNQRHWSIDDPAAVVGTEEVRLTAFRSARDELRQRIEHELLPDLVSGSNR